MDARLNTNTRAWAVAVVLTLCGSAAPTATAQTTTTAASTSANSPLGSLDATAESAIEGIGGPSEWTSRERLSSSLQIMLMLTVISLAPAVLLMTTSFVRIIVVLGLLRQALGTQQLPPSQVLTSIALFVTLLIMTPVWTKSYEDGIKPYSNGEIDLQQAFERSTEPVRIFMADQISHTGNHDDVYLFLSHQPDGGIDPDTGEMRDYAYYDLQEGETLVPITALLPAFMLSELKTAFLIGFQIYLPFVILDIIVASVTISMGMLMLPPVLISLPFKLLLFVLLDGWRLVIEMLLHSFSLFTVI
ncbi:flagellar type III secretion system pore protein FliP [Posidoniimonas polymericola]|uniref:flagellar type III secretion system pore protein FliP n=1 Tax=Posidoniimonas polymericola TaxID=2528002 RepID=UPI001E36EAED|nr:flagellar type III secretion system pore protein FliP [Posidoniimonas polymericola]